MHSQTIAEAALQLATPLTEMQVHEASPGGKGAVCAKCLPVVQGAAPLQAGNVHGQHLPLHAPGVRGGAFELLLGPFQPHVAEAGGGPIPHGLAVRTITASKTLCPVL